MLQRNSRHSDKSIRMFGTPLRYFFILKLHNVASQGTVCRISPRIDVDRLVIDTLSVHIDESLRVAKRDIACEIGLRCCSQRRVLDQVPDFRHETVSVSVNSLHAASGDQQFTALAGGRADLKQRKSCDGLEKVSAVRH